MISVLLYGRNDSHGYNLHRRAALSINCLAESLNHAGDEILFVDWNTPSRLPTFPKAISDTLTKRSCELLKIIRVDEKLHSARFSGLTSLPTVEPVARNVALVRSNSANRWILSTNTDMIFLTKSGSLSESIADLPDGYYALPRYELPEFLWELLPRTNPQESFRRIESWKEVFALENVVESFEFNRYDAPGDFQLVPREVALRLGGFDERMVLGWHVDSNFARRMNLEFGRSESLAGKIEGFHTNHTRSITVHHQDRRTSNDLQRFVWDVKSPDWRSEPGQQIGLADAELELVTIADEVFHPLETMHLSPPGVVTRRFTEVRTMRAVDPFVALTGLIDVAETLGRRARILYVGVGEVGALLAESVAAGLAASVLCAPLDRPLDDDVLLQIDWLIVDFSIPGLERVETLGELGKDERSKLALLCMRMSELSKSCARRHATHPVASIVNAEGNEFSRLAGLFVTANGGQTAFGVRTGSIRVGGTGKGVHTLFRWAACRYVSLMIKMVERRPRAIDPRNRRAKQFGRNVERSSSRLRWSLKRFATRQAGRLYQRAEALIVESGRPGEVLASIGRSFSR